MKLKHSLPICPCVDTNTSGLKLSTSAEAASIRGDRNEITKIKNNMAVPDWPGRGNIAAGGKRMRLWISLGELPKYIRFFGEAC